LILTTLTTQLSDVLAVLLVHDLLLSKDGIAASPKHPLHVAISRHKSRLVAEFTRLRIRKGFSSLEQFRAHAEGEADETVVGIGSDTKVDGVVRHARWVRINTLKSSLQKQLHTTLAEYEAAKTLDRVLVAPKGKKVYFIDQHIKTLIALPPGHDVSNLAAYKVGEIIVQDKASCFPATLLDPASWEGDMIDACAAPGNKTTHLAALASAARDENLAEAPQERSNRARKIFAFEKDAARSKILAKMVTQAGASTMVSIAMASDFLQAQPDDSKYANVTGILLDPSCSGSGIVGRDDEPTLHLPASHLAADQQPRQSQPHPASRKRKRSRHAHQEHHSPQPEPASSSQPGESERGINGVGAHHVVQRLEALAAFQLRLLQHAMSFPAARRIVYSTCSVHTEENEGVVVRALDSHIAKSTGWKLLPRKKQCAGLQRWPIRGSEYPSDASSPTTTTHQNQLDLEAACIRCEKGTSQGTMGFFVAAFFRDPQNSHVATSVPNSDNDAAPEQVQEDEWAGFSDSS